MWHRSAASEAAAGEGDGSLPARKKKVPRKGKKAGKAVEVLGKVSRIPGFDDVVPMWDAAIDNNVRAAWDEIG